MIQIKVISRVVFTMLLASFISFSVAADEHGLLLEPEYVLPEIAVESTYNGFEDVKHSVVDGKRIANSLSYSSESGTRVGVLRYRNEKGKSHYGFGYRRNLAGKNIDTLVSSKGLLFATEQNKMLLNLHIKSHEPENDEQSTYVQFSLMGNW